MNFSSTPTMSNRGPSSHHEFFAKLYGAFDDKTKNDQNKNDVSNERENVEENICVDEDIDVDSDSDNSTMSTKNDDDRMKNDASLRQHLSPSLPSLGHPTSGIF